MKIIKRKIKQASIVIVFILTNLLIFSIVSKIYYEFNSGGDRTKALHIELDNNAYYFPSIDIKIKNSKGRKLNLEVLKNIKKDYLNAWYVKSYALKNNDTESFRDFYTDSAQVKLTEIINYNHKNKITVASTTLKHNLEILYFSEDGQLLFLKDKNVEEISEISQNGIPIHKEITMNDYDVVLLLEDGFWRVRHLIKTKHKENNAVKIKHLIPKAFKIKGINYYPQNTPWFEFWKKFNPLIIDDDFKKINKLKLNTVRIFIPYKLFGKATVFEEQLKNLKTTLDLAEKNDLKIILTLFDFYGDYNIANYNLCDRHIEQIIAKVKNHKALLQYDIKNEPDLDFKKYSAKKVLNWLRFIAERIKKYDSNTPVTIGWNSSEKAHLLESELDVVSYHYYKNPKDFIAHHKALLTKTNKPIVVQEFGKHSYNSFWFPFSNSEISQAKYHKEIQEQFNLLENINYVNWTLYDFPNIDSKVFGYLPQHIFPQKNYGLIDVNGNYKESSKFLTSSSAKIDTFSFKIINKFIVTLLIASLFILIFIKFKSKK